MTAPDAPHFTGEVRDGVGWATLNRPKSLNAFSPEMRDGMISFFRACEHDPAVRCIVLRGAGGHFMAGGDIKIFGQEMSRTPSERREALEATCHAMHPVIYLLRRLPKPVLASVEGACAGLGVSLLLASDLAIASEKSHFTLAYAKIGTSPDGGASFFLPRAVGMKRAAEIAFLSDRFDSATAERYGLVNWVVPADALARETETLARRLAASATQAIGRTKALLSSALANDLEHHLQREGEAFGACAATEDMAEGITAFFEKRQPTFRNR